MMTRTLTISSGAATPKTERSACVIQAFPGTARIAANGALAIPRSEMLAAPSRKAIQTRAGGPGRSSAAMTSHSTNNAGAIAAAPMTVGRDSSSSICMELYLVRNANGYKFSGSQENQTRWGLAWMYALGWSVFGELNFMDFGIRSPRSFRDLRDRISNGRAAGKVQPADQ